MPVSVSVDSPNLGHLAAVLRKADYKLKKEMVATVRKIGKTVEKAEKDQALDLTSSGGGVIRSTAARQSRANWYLRGRSRPVTQRQWDSAMKNNSGLRKAIARTIKLKVITSGMGEVSLRAAEAAMPPDQRGLLRKSTLPGGWRHPVMGNRRVWVQQNMNPPDWWDKVGKIEVPRAKKEIDDTLHKYVNTLLGSI